MTLFESWSRRYGLVQAAFCNEVSVEQFFYKSQALDPQEFWYCPKIAKLGHYRNSRTFRIGLAILWFLWPLANIFYNYLVFLRCFYNKAFFVSGKDQFSTYKNGPILFASSPLAIRLASESVGLSGVNVVVRPFEDSDCYREFGPVEARCENCLNYLSFIDLLVIFFQATIFSTYMCFFNANSRWRLVSYFNFELLTVAKALENISSYGISDAFFVDHFDRWAVMMDLLAEDRAFSNLEMIQHGIVSSGSAGKMPFELNYKLRHVNVLWYFDESSVAAFKDSVFSHECDTQYRVYQNSIRLRPVESSKIKVLFVGHAVCLEFHKLLYDAMVSTKILNEALVFYKPHPTQIYRNPFDEDGWTVWDDLTSFPEVDLVISYPSSLAYQYDEFGFSIVVHALDAKEGDVDTYIEEILELLRGKYGI